MKRTICVVFLLFIAPVFGLRADLNGDCRVDMLDMVILLQEWMQIDEDCMANNYITFDGSTGLVTVPDNAALDFGTGDFSICFWAYPVDYGLDHVVFRKGTPSDFPVLQFTIEDGGGQAAFYYGDDIGNYIVALSSNSGFTDRWHHFAVVRDGAVLYMYVDGSDVTTSESSGSPEIVSVTNTSNLTIGENYDSKLYKGSFDDFRIYKSALTEAEILTIYNAGKGKKYDVSDTPTSGAASAAWNMDEGTGTTITDEVGSLVGTFTGGVTWQSGGVPFSGGLSIPMSQDDPWEW